MDTIPNTKDLQYTQSKMDAIPNVHNAECALISIYSYLSVVYVCLISTFYKDAFNKKLFSSKHSRTVRIRPQFHAVIVCYGFVIIAGKIITCLTFSTVRLRRRS